MKALTTILAERATASQDGPADGLKTVRDNAVAFLGEEVVDACPFSRPTSYAGNLAARQFGPLGRLALRKHRQARAGGLPQHFVLAVTRDDVIAIEQTYTVRGGTAGVLGPSVARWPRAALTVTTKQAGYLTNVSLSPPGGEATECCVSASPLTASFLDLLGDPSRRTPSADADSRLS